MIDALIRARGLRTGRFTSPHVESMTERISIDGEPLTEEAFVRAYLDVAPYLDLVDADQRAPAVVLRAVVGDGLRRVRRRPGRRRRGRGRHGRLLGRDQRRRRRGRRGHPDRGRPRAVPRRPPAGDRGREGRDHQARARSWSSPSRAARCWRCSPSAPARSGATLLARGRRLRRRRTGVAGRRRPGDDAARPATASTTRSSCRCTAPTRRRTPPSRWPRSRRCAGGRAALDDELVREAFAEVTSPGPARGGPPRADDPARRRAQPARRRRGGRGDPRLVHLRPAGRRGRGDGRQGRRGPARRARAGALRDRLHPELHRAGDAGRGAGRDRRATSSASTGSRVAPRLDDAIEQAVDAGRDRRVRSGSRSARAVCSSPARSSPSARPGRCWPRRRAMMGRIQRVDVRGRSSGSQAVVLGSPRRCCSASTDVDTAAALVVGLGLTVACLVAAGLLRAPVGGALGLGGPGRRDRARLRGPGDVRAGCDLPARSTPARGSSAAEDRPRAGRAGAPHRGARRAAAST